MPTLYERRILNEPEIHLSFGDPLIPIVSADNVTIELSNTDAFFDNLDLRGSLITYARFDEFSLEQLAELTGRVTSQTTKVDRVILTTTVHDLGDLQTLIPKLTVDAVTFPKADPQQGLGKVIPVAFGLAGSTNKVSDAWELPYVGEDIASNYYDYLVGKGTFANISVYRNTYGDTLFLVPGGEYTVNTTAYPGYTVIRFVLRQASFGGGMHRLFAAADSADYGRNFVTNAQALLSNATWGLGGSVNAASATAGAADMDSVGSMFCDGVMNVQRPALDWLNQLLIVRGIKLDKNSSGEWTFAVDKLASTVQATFGHGKGQQWANVTDFGGLETTPESSAIKSLVLEYRKDLWENNYVLATTARNPLANGKELRLQNEFIRNTTTGDKVADYIAKRLTYGDVKIGFGAGQEARRLRPGDLINYESMRPLFSKTLRVIDLQRGLTKTKLGTEGWNPAIYTYTPATLPAEPAAVTQTDNTRTAPTAASSLSVASSGVETTDQGIKAAYMVLQYTVPDESWASTVVRYTKDGETIWTTLPGENGSGVKQTKITGLVGSQVYDLRVTRQNVMNATLTADADLANQTAPGDTTAPSDPTAIAVRQAGGKVVEIDLTFTAPSDWGTTILYRNTTNNSGTATEIKRGKQKSFQDQNVSYGTTYYYWAKVVDQSGNASGFSPSASHSILVAQIVTGDVTDGNITTPKLPDGAVTTPKVPDNAITVSGGYANDGSIAIGTSETEIGTLTLTTNGGNVPVVATAYFNGDAGRIDLLLRKSDGTLLAQARMGYADGVLDDTLTTIGIDTGPSSSQTYKLYAQRSLGGTFANGWMRRLVPFNLKK